MDLQWKFVLCNVTFFLNFILEQMATVCFGWKTSNKDQQQVQSQALCWFIAESVPAAKWSIHAEKNIEILEKHVVPLKTAENQILEEEGPTCQHLSQIDIVSVLGLQLFNSTLFI